MLKDLYNRKIDYLRLSVTDRCNLRCVYCLPENYISPDSAGSMTDKEIVDAVSWLSELGIKKVRITGGEPLLRPSICGLIAKLSEIKKIEDLSLTTNGVHLKRLARDLKSSGLHRINVSVDTLDPSKFKEITRSDNLYKVLEGIESALAAGLSPVKINAVIFRGINDEEINEFISLTEKLPVHVRFIEAMPIGYTAFFSKEKWITSEEMRNKALHIEPLPPHLYPRGNGPARYYSRRNAMGTVGFISALSDKFCSSCNRIRLSSKGVLFPCLDSKEGVDIRDVQGHAARGEDICRLIQQAVSMKPEEHHMLQKSHSTHQDMCAIGG